MSDQLRGGTTIGGYLALHQGNFNSTLKDFTSLSLTGDVSGSGGFDIDGLLTLDINVSNNSHAHTISNISGLQTALDAKAPQSTTYTKTETNSQISTRITTHTNVSSAHHARYEDSEAVAALSSADVYIPKISSPIVDNVPKINADGKLVDSGINIVDVATGKGYAYVRRTSVVIGASPSNTISFSIANFEKITDSIIVYENLVYYMEEGVDYIITNNNTLTFDSDKPAGTRFDIIAFMNVPEAGETYSGMYVTDSSITNAKLATSIKIGNLSNLAIGSSHTNIVSAINSVYESAAKVDNPLTLQFDAGSAVGTDKYVFDGSKSIGINIKGGTNIRLAKSAGTITINSSGTYNRATSVLSGATVFSDITISKGMVTNTATRKLSPADIGAAPSSHNHSASNITTGILGVGRGGTGASTFTSGKVLFGNGTSAINTNGNLHWNNTNSRLGVGTAAPDESIHTPGAVKAESGFVVGNFKMEYNDGTESLQFNFVG